MIRPAVVEDVSALVAVENRCFVSDRFSRRQFRHLLTRANAVTLVEDEGGEIQGYVNVLFHAGTSLARLYSCAVVPERQGRGLGRTLLSAAEAAARDRGSAWMRLEVRPDNDAAISLYHAFGYRRFEIVNDYYDDHADALRMEKRLVPASAPSVMPVPYYRQTLDFTCGPAAIMMAMAALRPTMTLDRVLELRVWRESTTIFMTSGHGGCGPYGLALAARHRGFDVELIVNDGKPFFVDSVRSAEKKEVIRLVHEDMMAEAARLNVPVRLGQVGIAELERAFEAGGIPVVLVSSYRIYREKFPHWVVVTGFDDRFVYVHDPYVDDEKDKTVTDCAHLPIPKQDFGRIARYGKAQQIAVLILRR